MVNLDGVPDTEHDNPLGAYLRAHRERVDPADRGLPPRIRRRVAGLRREEVAELAGVSLHYYIRLEQGRDRHPSPSVLDALARVLGVDEQGRTHLRRLAEPELVRGRGVLPERARPELVALMDQWTEQAGLVLGRYRDVLAANALATAINPNFTLGRNLLREVFLDPAARTTYPDWEQVAAEGVAALRASVGACSHDPVRDELVSELCAASPDFARLWARQDAREKPSGRQRFCTPTGGTLDLHYEPFAVPHSDGQILYVFFATVGTEDARLLGELSRPAARVDRNG